MMGIAQLFSSLFDEVPWTASERQSFVKEPFADLLTYRIHDPTTNLYHNDGTVGFLLETPPVIGIDIFRTLQTVLGTYCPQEGSVQFLSWTSPNLFPSLARWGQERVVQTALMQRMIERRIQHFQDMRFGSDHAIKCVPHRRRVFVAGWLDGEPSDSQIKTLREFRKNLILAFGGDQACISVGPATFLGFLTEVLHSRGDTSGEAVFYDEDVALNYQVPGAGLAVSRDGLSFLNAPELSVSSASVRSVRRDWCAALGALYNGSPDRPQDAPHGPVLTSLVARSRPSQSALGEVVTRRAKIAHTQSTSFRKWAPDIDERAQDFETLQTELEQGERLFETLTTVSAYARGDVDDSAAALAEIEKIYAGLSITLEKDRFFQLPIFLSALPFQVSGKLLKDFQNAARIKKRKGAAVAALAPLHGEYAGMGSHKGLILVGRQGQVFDWDNYNSSGNYNVAVVGKSGAGKSVFMQELVTDIYSGGGRVLVIDDGHSFQTTCELLGGDWLGIGSDGSFKLNPFSMVSAEAMEEMEYRAEALELITRVVATMANLGAQKEGRVQGIEEELISNACGVVWDAYGHNGNVTEVVRELEKSVQQEPRLADVAMKLKRFARGGIYGEIFDGPANVSIQSAFTVFELSELKSHKDLEAVVLQIIMFLGTELMFKTDRGTRVAIVIDEAWDMLGGAGTSAFLEGVVRRARKYTGALITGTQSLLDYYDNQAATVCLENSDWLVALAQKPEVIDQLVSNGRLSVPDGVAHSLKSLISVKGQFSEMAIRGPEGWVFGRLMLDPYSLAVFSSTGQVVQRLNELRDHRGMSIADALDIVVEDGLV